MKLDLELITCQIELQHLIDAKILKSVQLGSVQYR